MESTLNILVLVAVAAVAVTLGFGIRSLYRDGPEARSRSNKLMRLRVLLQAVAVCLLVAVILWRSTHGG